MKLLKELMEEAKPKSEDIIVNGKKIGSIWRQGNEWHVEHDRTGMSWAGDEGKEDAIQLIKDHHEESK